MNDQEKPRIGMLGIMQELYDDMLPGITEHQEDYAREVVGHLRDLVEIDFPRAARNRQDIEDILQSFQTKDLDGVMIVMLTYGPGLRIVRALQQNTLPILLANIQPESTVTEKWDMADLTYNQGVHGAQDTANMILRTTGSPPSIISEDWRSDRFREYVHDWAKAARTARKLREMRLVMIGQMQGMGDILTDPAAFMRTLGPQLEVRGIGSVYNRMESVTDGEIQNVKKVNAENFEIDPAISEKQYSFAARFQVGISKLLEDEGYGGFSIYFNSPGEDGRFEQIPMMAASNLMAEGYGYAAEGDMNCTALVAAGHILAGDAHFTEMYAMDFERDAILQSHMGEGNWKIANNKHPIKLIDRELGIGGLDNPPTVLFSARPGPATLATLVSLRGDQYRLVVSQGEVLETDVLPNVEMPYFHFRPEEGVRSCLDGWLRNGGTHHQCMLLGDQRRRWRLFSEITGIEFVEV